ncbi:helix-turn-helix domain-containing protein [Streptomyces sp. N2-109]|uniref:Helix-turn-helix domain-containing protein n=1 Tax=Streptomyces gossypii TaxID=2883101 RepID=A0ABT2JT64_9ACTN|nr:helix-turn-helix domain-containing protein [Streptomyces gossypii]MCT2591087.1 helix-turn-helix domain-containing protein [Streptomyces gossypii]
MSRRLYDYDEAAEELRVTKSWLQRHIKRLPHVDGLGGHVLFTDDHLDRILAAHCYEPEQHALSAVPGGGSHPLAELKPLPARSRRTG